MNTGIIAAIKNLAPLPLYLAVVIVAFASLFGKTRWGLFLWAFLFPLQNIIEKLHQFPLGKDLNDITLIAILLGWVFLSLSKQERFIQPSALNKLLIFMAIYTYFSLWQGSSFLGLPAPIDISDVRVQAWKNYMIFPLLFFITANNIKNEKQLKWLLIVMVLSMFLMNYYTVNQLRWRGSIESRARFQGTFSYLGPNEVAAFYATYTFVLAGIFLFIKEKLMRIFLLGAILPNIYCILFLFSRGAYLATLVGSSFLSFFKNKALFILFIILAFSWQAILPSQVIERINQTKTESGELDPSAQKRLIMWNQSVELFKQNPITGAGFYTIPYFGFELGDTHNIFVKVAAEQGIIGLGILLLIFFFSLRSGWRLYKKAKSNLLRGLGLGFCACVVAVMVGNFFGDRWTHTPLGAYYWIFLGLVESGNIITRQQLQQNQNAKNKTKNSH